MRRVKRAWTHDAGAVLALIAAVVVLYRKVVRLWWTYDDAWTLHLAIENRARDFFISGALWPQKLFTPLLTTMYEVELRLFGLAPQRWYVVQLLLTIAAALALYLAARMYLGRAASFVGALLFVASVPLCSIVTELSTLHYLLCIILGAFAIALWSRGAVVASSVLYFAAMLAKETAIPLVALFFVLPPRTKRPWPHVVAAAVYFGWRFRVLGTLLGGYGWAIKTREWPRIIATLPWKLATASAGAGVVAGIALLLVIVVTIVAGIRGRGAIVLLLVALALAAGPILPVSKEMQRRYSLVPFLTCAIAFAAAAERLPRRARIAVFVLAPMLAIVANRQEWRSEFAKTRRMSDEARFFFYDEPPGGLLRTPTVPPAAMNEVAWLRQHEGRAAGASWFFDDIYLCESPPAGKRVWEYDASRHAIVEITNSMPAIVQRSCGAIRNAPLATAFHFDDGVLDWEFGPYRGGRYRIVFGNGAQAFDVPAHDSFHLGDTPGISFRVAYVAPEGWATYSPELALDFRKQRTFAWKR
jgi:hypothetical protein